jgi:hypothetical protein
MTEIFASAEILNYIFLLAGLGVLLAALMFFQGLYWALNRYCMWDDKKSEYKMYHRDGRRY